MNIHTEGDRLLLEKNGETIGHCHTAQQADGSITLQEIAILARWQRKGYGSYLLKALLQQTGGYDAKTQSRYQIDLPTSEGNVAQADAFPTAFFEKFGFVAVGNALVREHRPEFTATGFVHQFLAGQLHAPTLCIDATCGNGHDSLFLAKQLPENGQLLAIDLQQSAMEHTAARLANAGISSAQYRLICDNHANLAQYAAVDSADAIIFNFGWLPGADHGVFSGAQSSIPALTAALSRLKPGGILSATLYSGQGIGSSEKDAILQWLQTLPIAQYTVLVCNFANWASTAPLPCFVIKK